MPVLVPGFIFGAVSFVLLALSAQNHLLFFLSAIINGLYSGLTYPALNAWAVKNTPAHRRSAAMSTYLVSIDIGVGLAGIIWGALIDAMGFITVYYIVAVLLAGTLAMSVAFFGKTFKPGMFKKSVNQAE